MLVSTSEDESILIFDLLNGSLFKSLEGYEKAVKVVCFSLLDDSIITAD
jgi:hypothetical protein